MIADATLADLSPYSFAEAALAAAAWACLSASSACALAAVLPKFGLVRMSSYIRFTSVKIACRSVSSASDVAASASRRKSFAMAS